MDDFKYGIKKEDQLAAWLRQRGWICRYFKGSRGAGDVVAKRGKQGLLIQMKSTRRHIDDAAGARRHILKALTINAQLRLTRAANLRRLAPAVGVSSGSYVWLFDPRNNEFAMLAHGRLPQRGLQRG